MWCPENFQIISSLKEDRWIILIGKILQSESLCTIILVYGRNSKQQRLEIYRELSSGLQSVTHPVMIIGDFNEILCVIKRKGQDKEK